MALTMEEYRPIVGDEIVAKIHARTARLYNKHIVHVNSTYQGGGVAEMLQSLIPLLNDVGLYTGWRILPGSADFFGITKSFHNALQGHPLEFDADIEKLYVQTVNNFSRYTHIAHDAVIVHDPQPLPLIRFYQKRQPWVWRCHIDIEFPDPVLWDFLKNYILRYDLVVISNDRFRRNDLPTPQRVIYPAIDPLSLKNRELTEEEIDATLAKFGVPVDKPFITQISRFDKFKDMHGILDIYKMVREEYDCRLVLAGSMAADDPEGRPIFEQVQDDAKELIDSGDVILITVENNTLVNALQRRAAVVFQKSLREGFGLTVTEAMWKGTPVIGSNIGGIPIQIKDGETGFLVEPRDLSGAAEIASKLLKNPELKDAIGRNAKESVRTNFLITRSVLDWLRLLSELLMD